MLNRDRSSQTSNWLRTLKASRSETHSIMPLSCVFLPAEGPRIPVLLLLVSDPSRDSESGVLAGIKELSYSEDLLTLTQGNADEGYMNGPSP